MRRNIHSPLPLKGFNKIIIFLVQLRRQMTSFLFFKHQILKIGMISCPFMIICKFLVVRIKWIPLIFAHDVVFWCFVFHFRLQLLDDFVPTLHNRDHVYFGINELFLNVVFCMLTNDECQHFTMLPTLQQNVGVVH
jgi:hypothetical protein